MKKRLNLLAKAVFALLIFPAFFSGCGEDPLACFDVPSKLVDQNFPVPFDNCSQFQQEGYTWDFGDGSSSSTINPTHKFITQGEYLVSLTSLAKNSENNDVVTDIIRVGSRILNTINITNLPATKDNGDPWDAADGPDIKVMFEDLTTNTIAYTTSIESDVSLPATIVFSEASSNVDLLPREWKITIADDDGATFEIMGEFTIDLNTYEPTDEQTINFNDTESAISLIYSLN